MKKVKVTRPFWFKTKSHKQMVELLNIKYPINMKYNEKLIDKIHNRCPFLDKVKISIIVSGVFSTMRDLLVLGKILNFHNLFFDFKLFFFDYKRNGRIFPSLKSQLTTPPKIKNND